jgi:tRNA G18 (ribose-2'-O)-methylase SpoU
MSVLSIKSSLPIAGGTRKLTRRQRQSQKDFQTLPMSICCVNFEKEVNVAHAMRSAACFGAGVQVIGQVGVTTKALRAISGSVNHRMTPEVFSTPQDWIQHCRKNGIRMIALECPTDHPFDSKLLHELELDGREISIVVGHETSGVPVEILKASECFHIAMPGFGSCLNTAQTANIALYELSKRFS